MSRSCPDCTAVGPDLRHDDTCPVGRALDATGEQDRAWFDAHPDQRQRVRLVEGPERTYLQLAGCSVASAAFVVVSQLAPGVRTRSYRGVYAPSDVPTVPTGAAFRRRA